MNHRSSLLLGLIAFFTVAAPVLADGTETSRPQATNVDRIDTRLPLGASPPRVPEQNGWSSEAQGGIDVPAPRDQNFPVTTDARPIRPFDGNAPQPGRDIIAGIAGQTDGDLLVIVHDDKERLVAHTSGDAGDTFSAETVIPFGGEILRASADLVTGSDTVVVTGHVADPNGSIGLEAACTNDFGASWSVRTLVQNGDATHGTSDSVTAVNGSTVGILYQEDPGSDLFLFMSFDGCATFQGPVRVNLHVPEAGGNADDFWIDVEPGGAAHIAYRDLVTSWDLYYVKCQDPGSGLACGTPEALVPPIIPAHQSSANPFVAVNCNGDPSVAFADDEGTDHTYVIQKDDSAGTWTVRQNIAGSDNNYQPIPLLNTFDPTCTSGDGDVILTYVDSAGSLLYTQSTDGGGSYGALSTVATGVGAHPTFGSPFAPVAKDGAGNCLTLWTDNTSDSYVGTRTDVFARQGSCADLSGFTSEQIDGAPGAGAWYSAGSIAPCGPNRICAIWIDDRNAQGKSGDTFFNRRDTTPGSESWGMARRIDQDGRDVLPATFNAPRLASGSGTTVVAVSDSSAAAGEYRNVFWTKSIDGGHTWALPAALTSNAGSENEGAPHVLCEGDCSTFHVALNRFDQATLTWNLETTSTADGGSSFTAPLGHGSVVFAEYDLFELPGSGVGLAWTDSGGANIRFSKTTDGGTTWSAPQIVDQNGSGFNRNPHCCSTDGTNIGCVIAAPDVQFSFFTSKIVFSNDGGSTWVDEQQLMPDGTNGGAFFHHARCFVGPNGNPWAAVQIEDTRMASSQLIKAEFVDLVTHTQQGELALGPEVDPEYLGSTDCEDCAGGGTCSRPCFMTLALQTPGNGTHRVDACRVDPASNAVLGCLDLTQNSPSGDGTPVPTAFSWDPLIVRSNQTGQPPEYCVAWQDESAGNQEFVRRCSADEMVSFGDTVRWTTGTPQGTHHASRWNFPKDGECAALPDASFCAVAVSNLSLFFEWQILPMSRDDGDFDGAASAGDCDDTDPDLQAVPGETGGVRAATCGPDCVDLSWDPPASAGCTCTLTYETLSASLSDVRAGNFGNFVCLADDLASPAWTDNRPDPAPGEGYAYLTRAQNPCGFGTVGDASLPLDPRDDLDANDVCGP